MKELLFEIHARPDDDPPRLALADALGDQRGEYIRLACAGKTRQAEALFQRNHETWIRELVPGMPYKGYHPLRRFGVTKSVRFERGMAEGLYSVTPEFVLSEPSVPLLPLRSLGLIVVDPHQLEALAESPALDHLEELKVAGDVGAAELAAFLASDKLQHVRRLQLSQGKLSPAERSKVVRALKSHRELRELNVGEVSEDLFQDLPNLKTLWLRSGRLDDAAFVLDSLVCSASGAELEQLLKTNATSELKSLSLSGGGVESLPDLPRTLERLGVAYQPSSVLDSLTFDLPLLHTLTLCKLGLQANHLDTLLANNLDGLRMLNLAMNQIDARRLRRSSNAARCMNSIWRTTRSPTQP